MAARLPPQRGVSLEYGASFQSSTVTIHIFSYDIALLEEAYLGVQRIPIPDQLLSMEIEFSGDVKLTQ